MLMRRTAVLVLLVATPAMADTFSGFSGVDRPYLINQDKVCQPLKVANGAATGVPQCDKAAADVVARLSIKAPIPQSGNAKAAFAASASGRTLTVNRKTGEQLFTWDAMDPITKVVEVYASQYEDRIAVAFATRRMGKEVTDVVAFDLGQGQTAIRDPNVKDPNVKDPNVKDPNVKDPTANVAPEDPKVAKAVATARKTPKGAKALAAWQAVLALDPGHTEALFSIAASQIVAKQTADAIATLTTLAGSAKPDAIEWLVDARFDPAFAAVRADPKFRAAVGLDRKPTTTYERMMGFGGQWEQTATSCDKPEIRLNALRDRSFKLRVKTACEGMQADTGFKGTWRLDGDKIVLTLPNRGKAVTAADEAGCVFEKVVDEDALRCHIGKDLEFSVLPTRR
jgi:hypothetical protein